MEIDYKSLFENLNDHIDLLKFTTKFSEVDSTVVLMDDSKITICGLDKEIIEKIYFEFISLL
jgi:hypothetical protein